MSRDETGTFCKATARDYALCGIYTSYPLDETPFILIFIQKTNGLSNRDQKLVFPRRVETLLHGHEARKPFLASA